MRIAIPSTGENLKANLDTRFGRCKGFLIVDNDAGTFEYKSNRAQAQGGGAGISAAQVMVDLEVDVVIAGSLGPNALRVLKSADIKAVRCEAVSVEEALKRFAAGELAEIEAPGAAHAGINKGR